MAVRFNPFTGQLQIDEKGSGGGAQYIDGEVATYNDLPLDGTAALNSAWLVRTASGVWPVSRKQAGIYIRTATGGSSRDADFTYAGTMPDVFSDAVLTIYDEASTTRTGQFNLGSITAGQNRVLTWPDGNGTIARTEDFAAPPAIGNTTRASGAFTTLNATNGTITASAPVLDLSQTWNNAAVAFTGLRFDVTNTTSSTSSRLVHLTVGGTNNAVGIYRDAAGFAASPRFEIGSTGVAWNIRTRTGGGVGCNFDGAVCVGGSLQFNTVGSTSTSAGDVILNREAADTLALQRTTNPQTFRLYNTFTDASNYERGFLRWSSNVLQIGTEAGGTGSNRNIEFIVAGSTRLTLSTATAAVLATTYRVGNGGDYQFGGVGVRITGTSSGTQNITFQTNSTDRLVVNDTLLGFGGTTSSFPALKRSSTTLQVRLADDSSYSVLDAQLRAQGTAPATSGATGTAGDIRYDADYIYVCTAANTWKRAAIATW